MARKKSKNTGLVVTMLAVSLVGGAAIGAYVVSTPTELPHKPGFRETTATAKTEQTGLRVIPRPDIDGNVKFKYEKSTIPPGQDARLWLVNEYLKELHQKGLGDPKARAIGIDVRDHVAHLSFNDAFDQTYGSMDEGTVLNGIRTTLGQFDNIDKVLFEIDGKPMDTMGNVDLTEGQTVIRPNGGEASSPTPDVP